MKRKTTLLLSSAVTIAALFSFNSKVQAAADPTIKATNYNMIVKLDTCKNQLTEKVTMHVVNNGNEPGQLPQTEVQGLVARQLALTRTPTCLDTDLTYQQQSFDYCRQRSSNYQSLLSPRIANGLQPFQAAFFILGFCHLLNPFSKMFTAAFQSRIWGIRQIGQVHSRSLRVNFL